MEEGMKEIGGEGFECYERGYMGCFRELRGVGEEFSVSVGVFTSISLIRV